MAKLMLNSSASRIVSNQNGFTLIEIFISIVLLTVGLMVTAVLTTGVVRGNLGSRNMTTATAIAQSCLEENRRVGYTNAGTGGLSNCATGSTIITTSGGVSFTRDFTIDTSVSNIKTLTVAVS